MSGLLFCVLIKGFIMKVEIKGKQMIITVDMQTPSPSASGKTLVVASSRGNVATAAIIDGKPVVVGFNAYIRKDLSDHPSAPDHWGRKGVILNNLF